MQSWTLDELRHRHTRRPPIRSWFRAAAVAVVCRQVGADTEVLLIERVVRPGKRWSGDMAFPGGLREPGDVDLESTARRECAEEVGLRLGPSFGRVRDVWTVRPQGLRPMSITPFLFEAPQPAELVLERTEVASSLWVSLGLLRDPSRRETYPKRIGPVTVPFPSVRVGERRVWGLTLQMIDRL